MGNVIVETTAYDSGLLDISLLQQTPDLLFMEHWKADRNTFNKWLEKHKIKIDWSQAKDIKELHSIAIKVIDQFINAVNKDAGEFDFRFKTMLLRDRKMLLAFDEKQYVKVTFDISGLNENEKKLFTNTFFSLSTRSLFDFRDMQGSNNTLELIYYRRGIADEVDRLTSAYSKVGNYFIDRFKVARDVNYILSGVVYDLAKATNLSFSYEYLNTNTDLKQMLTKTAQEIIATSNIKAEVESKNQEIQELKTQVKAEIKDENASKNRDSQPPESNKKLVEEEGSTTIVLEKSFINQTSDEVVESAIEAYGKKELLKAEERIKTAKENSKNAYKSLQEKIYTGKMTVFEAMNQINQIYRDDKHTIAIVGTLLTRDILQLGEREKEIKKLELQINNVETLLNEEKDNVISKEQTISSLRSTVTTKTNEFNLELEKKNEAIELISQNAEKLLKQVTDTTNKKFAEYDVIINGHELIQEKLKNERDFNTKQLEELKIEIKDNNNKIVTLSVNIEKYKGKTELLQTQLVKEQSELTKATSDNYINQNKHNEKIKELNEKYNILSQDNKTLNNNMEKLFKNNNLLKEENENLNNYKEKLLADGKLLQNTIDNLNSNKKLVKETEDVKDILSGASKITINKERK